jgi:hypothetical protein
MGEARTKLLMMTMDHTGFRPFLKHMMLLNTYYLDPKSEVRINTPQGEGFTPMFAGDLHPEFDFSARYTSMEPALGKQFRSQQLMQYAQMWAQSPYLQQQQFMKAIFELMDFQDSDKFLKSPQQVAQEQQAAMQQQIQLKALEMQGQDAMAAKQSGREMQRDLVKGIMA